MLDIGRHIVYSLNIMNSSIIKGLYKNAKNVLKNKVNYSNY